MTPSSDYFHLCCWRIFTWWTALPHSDQNKSRWFALHGYTNTWEIFGRALAHTHTHTHMHTQAKGLTSYTKCQPGGQLQAKLRKRFRLSERSLVQTSGWSVFKWISIRIPAAVAYCNCSFFLWHICWQHVSCLWTDICAGSLMLNRCWYSWVISCGKCGNVAGKRAGRWLSCRLVKTGHVCPFHTGSKSSECMREKVIWSPIWAHLGTAPTCRSEIEQWDKYILYRGDLGHKHRHWPQV